MTRKLFVVAFVAVLAVATAVALAAIRAQRNKKTDTHASTARASETNSGAARVRVPVVVELFTSEGCSSCPPADALLARMDETQPVEGAEVIALAQHVDYWNYLGWSDPYSSREFSERQGAYSRAFGEDGVYTPQMVVDGRAEFPGGKSGTAFKEIAQAAREPKAEVLITRADAQTNTDAPVRLSLRVEKLPKLSDGDAAEVLLAITEGGLASDVSRGENTGRKLKHVGVVRSLTKLGEMGAGAFSTETSVTPDKAWRRENLRAVVFIQERASRRVVGASSVKLFD
ncbi:MAG TPA: DUF1223 domain-containing protein [Pyrinomonadaceae bacterium]|jgi:hypothetical protein|nr:DUF1223 domain-containing protein [Pyrinomonadaceae bacterium]